MSSAAWAVVLVAMLIAPALPTAALAAAPAVRSAEARAGEDVHPMTAVEVEELKSVLGVRDPSVNYNVLYGENGTGYAPPSEEEYAAMVGQVLVRDSAPAAPGAPPSMDLSTDPRFPAVGNQGNVGSCAAWAMAYYCYGYLEAKDNGWADASLGNKAHLISPSWCYSKVNGGTDSGSWMGDVGEVLCTWGGATLATMPYVGTGTSPSRYLDWGGEAAFREAPLHRAYSVQRITLSTSDWAGTLGDVKAVVASGTPVTFALNAAVLDGPAGDKVVTSSEYVYGSLNHAQTIVGYDDSRSADGETGAFKVVNSWGAGFWGSGYYWITYEAFRAIGSSNQLVYITDREDYSPVLLGVWHYASPQRQDGTITVTTLGGSATVRPYYEDASQSLPNFICLDLSDLKGEYDLGHTTFRLSVTSSTTGTLSSFRTELYGGYAPGAPERVSAASPDTPTSAVSNVRSVLPPYPSAGLASAVDVPLADIDTGGRARWAPSSAAYTRGGTSAQSGDVAASSRSWLNLTLGGEGTLAFDWRLDCPGSSDTLSFQADGEVLGVLTASAPWARFSLDVPGPVTEVSWAFYRQGNGGGCGWVDNVTWARGDLHIDSDEELEATASSLGWSGSGTGADPYVAAGYSIDQATSPAGFYVGNTTLWLELVDCRLSGADRPGQAALVIYNSANVEVRGSTIAGNEVGVVVDGCSNVVLRSCAVTGSGDIAIRVEDSDGVVIEGCNISGNAVGLEVVSSQLTVRDNLFGWNSGLAVHATASPGGLYYGNVLVSNNGAGPSYDESARQAADDSSASWDNGHGNHWSDLTGPDVDRDGVVDRAYDLGDTADRAPSAYHVSEPLALAAARTGSDVSLYWDAPNRTFYAPVTGYEVARTSPGGTAVFTTTGATLLDGGPKSYGVYAYTVRARTALGPGPWSAPAVVEVPDLDDPMVSILSPSPGAWSRSTTVQVSWSASDPSSGVERIEVSLDGGAFSGVGLSNDATFSPLSAGPHQVAVRAFDHFGNSATATVSFSVDLTAPSITAVTPSPGSVVSGSAVTVSLSVRDTGSGYHRDVVRIDGEIVRDSTNANSISFSIDLDDGVHRIQVTSTDRAGNMASVSHQFTVDAAPPTVVVTSPTEGATVPADPSVAWEASDAAGLVVVELSVDGGAWTDVTGLSPYTIDCLAAGEHFVTVRVKDLAGRTAAASVNVTVDPQPLTAVMSVPDGVPLSGPVVVTFSRQIDASTLWWSSSFEATASVQGNELLITPTATLGPGEEHSVVVSARDLDGVGSGQVSLGFRTIDHGTVSGRLVDASGNPVAGATVTASSGRSAITGAGGDFSFELPFGPATLTAHKGGYSDLSWGVEVAAGETTSAGSKQLASAGAFDQALLPLAAVAVVALVSLVVVLARRRK